MGFFFGIIVRIYLGFMSLFGIYGFWDCILGFIQIFGIYSAFLGCIWDLWDLIGIFGGIYLGFIWDLLKICKIYFGFNWEQFMRFMGLYRIFWICGL